MYEFKEDKIGIIILDKAQSTSQKYTIFLGEHFNGIEQCFDIGAFNNQTGELVRRHYSLKWEAEEFYEEWKEKMRGSGEYETDEAADFSV